MDARNAPLLDAARRVADKLTSHTQRLTYTVAWGVHGRARWFMRWHIGQLDTGWVEIGKNRTEAIAYLERMAAQPLPEGLTES